MQTPFLRTPYNYDRQAISDETGLACDPAEGRTQEQFKEECDINTIVKRFGLTGELPDNPRIPQYGDFTGVMDFHTAQNAVRQAEEGFMELPPQIRARFANDPQKLLEFMADDNNRQEAERLGLVRTPTPTSNTEPATQPPGTPG